MCNPCGGSTGLLRSRVRPLEANASVSLTPGYLEHLNLDVSEAKGVGRDNRVGEAGCLLQQWLPDCDWARKAERGDRGGDDDPASSLPSHGQRHPGRCIRPRPRSAGAP